MAQDQISVGISIEEREALRALTRLTKGIDKFGDESQKSIKKTDSAMSSFKGNLAAIATSGAIKAIVGGLSSLATGAFEAAASTEKITTQLEVLTGSADKANALFKQLTDFSTTTPFQLQGIAEASAQLLSFGFEAETVQSRIARIGEVAAGSGSDLKEVALIYGQVAAAGKLTGERLLQLQERAIPIGSALANSLGVAESEVRELVSSGVVGFKEFEDAFNSMSDSGGIFEGAIQKQSHTVNGALSTLSDNFEILQTTIGNTFKKEVVDTANELTLALQEITKVVKENEDAFNSVAVFVKDYIVTYTNLAAAAIKTKTPLQEIDEEILKLVNRQQKAIATSEEAKKSMGEYFGIFDSDKAFSIKRSEINIKKLQEEIDKLQEKRKGLAAQQFPDQTPSAPTGNTPSDGSGGSKDDANQKILDARKKLYTQLDTLEQDRFMQESERKLANEALTSEQRILELEQIKFHEIQKADILLNAELEKNKTIKDAQTKALADKAAFAKNELMISQSQAKAEKAINDTRLKNQQLLLQGYSTALSQAASLARKGTAEQKVLGIASATINTYAAATRAYRDYPYPANIAVMATTIAAGLNQVSQIQKQSFATGGVVGGFVGATNGGDNTTANVRTGEMVLNGSEQRQLFDIATGRENRSSSPQMIEVTSIVQVDEREIARAVRNQRLEGFE